MSAAVADGVFPTCTPAASRASCLAAAVPDEPDTIAPAWPIVLPSGAVKPATYPTTGFGTFSLMNAAAPPPASPPVSPLLGVTADLADHHDRVGVRVVLERPQRVDVRGADDRVAADADRGREPEVAQLLYELVGQRAALADQADPAGRGDVGRDDAGVRRPGRR